MNHQPPPQAFGPTINRLGDLMAHTYEYAFRGVSRLAVDAGVDPASVSRLINGKQNPSFAMAARLTKALELMLERPIDPRDVFAENGEFLTRSICDLAGCRGCLPENALDEFGTLQPAFVGIMPGTWVTSRYPKGYQPQQKGEK